MDENQDLPRRIREAARSLAQGVREIPYEILTRKPPHGEWSIRDVMMQYADTALVQSVRLRWQLAEEHPVLMAIDKDKWTHRLCLSHRSLEVSLALMEVLHDSMADILDNIEPDDWHRSGYHPARGEVTLKDLAHHLIEEAESAAAMVNTILGKVT